MDYRLVLAGIGVASVLVIWGLRRAGRQKANAHLSTAGILVDGEVLACTVTVGRFTYTDVTFKFPVGDAGKTITAKRCLEGRAQMERGAKVPVRYLPSHPYVSMLVGYENRHDAS